MKMKILALVTLLGVSAFGLQTGDSLDKRTCDALGIEKQKVYVVDFFASWCHSCKKELPLIEKMRPQLEQKRVEIVGVNVDKEREKGLAFSRELGLNFRVVSDADNRIIGTFNPIGMPSLYLVKDQKIVDVVYGAVDNIDGVILEALERL